MLVRWSHTPQFILQGVGNHLRLQIPLYCMREHDELMIQSVIYRADHIHVEAGILRRPFLSQYLEMERFEPDKRELIPPVIK